jgi:hypothetical protein
MKIEIRDYTQNGKYRIKIKTVKITHLTGLVSTYIDNLFIHEPVWYLSVNEQEFDKKDEENFVELMRNPESIKLLTWALGIAEYDYPDQEGCFENKQRDYIWEQFIKYGLIEVKEKEPKKELFEGFEKMLEKKDAK